MALKSRFHLLRGQRVSAAAQDDQGQIATISTPQQNSIPTSYFLIDGATGRALLRTEELNGATLDAVWNQERKGFIFWGMLGTSALWKPGQSLAPLQLPTDLETRQIHVSAKQEWVWLIDRDPSIYKQPPRTIVKWNDSNFIATLRAVRGLENSKTVARFTEQRNFSLEPHLTCLRQDGTRFFALDYKRRLHVYDVYGRMRTVALPPPQGAKIRTIQLSPQLRLSVPFPPPINGFTLSRDGLHVATAALDGVVSVARRDNGIIRRWHQLLPCWAKAFLQYSPDGTSLLIGGDADKGVALYLLDARTLAIKAVYETKLYTVNGVMFFRRGDYVVCYGDGGLEIFPAAA